MTGRPGRRMSSAVAGLWVASVCSIAAAPPPARAASGDERISVVGVRANRDCIRQEIRLTGFAVAHDQGGASLMYPGYRVSEVLVGEGDAIKTGQELLRATRDDAPDAAQRGALPATMSLRSPMAGVVKRVNVRVGTVSGAAAQQSSSAQIDPQFMIVGPAGVDLYVDVPSLYASQISKGKTARVVAEEGVEVTGTFRASVSDIDPATQIGHARLTLDPAAALLAGQFASASVELARDCGIVVPRSALSYQNGRPVVQIINGSTIETRNVAIGLSDGLKVRIREGLSAGDPVVANAGDALRAGDSVNPTVRDR